MATKNEYDSVTPERYRRLSTDRSAAHAAQVPAPAPLSVASGQDGAVVAATNDSPGLESFIPGAPSAERRAARMPPPSREPPPEFMSDVGTGIEVISCESRSPSGSSSSSCGGVNANTTSASHHVSSYSGGVGGGDGSSSAAERHAQQIAKHLAARRVSSGSEQHRQPVSSTPPLPQSPQLWQFENSRGSFMSPTEHVQNQSEGSSPEIIEIDSPRNKETTGKADESSSSNAHADVDRVNGTVVGSPTKNSTSVTSQQGGRSSPEPSPHSHAANNRDGVGTPSFGDVFRDEELQGKMSCDGDDAASASPRAKSAIFSDSDAVSGGGATSGAGSPDPFAGFVGMDMAWSEGAPHFGADVGSGASTAWQWPVPAGDTSRVEKSPASPPQDLQFGLANWFATSTSNQGSGGRPESEEATNANAIGEQNIGDALSSCFSPIFHDASPTDSGLVRPLPASGSIGIGGDVVGNSFIDSALGTSDRLPSPIGGEPSFQSLQEIREAADSLRHENNLLREAYERRLAARTESIPQLPGSPSAHSVHSDVGVQGGNGPAMSAKVAELAMDLRNAVKRCVERRREVEERHLFLEEAHERRIEDLHEEIEDVEEEIDEARLEIEEAAFAREKAVSPNSNTSRDGLLSWELREEQAERDAAQRRTLELREELNGIDVMHSRMRSGQEERWRLQAAKAESAIPLRELNMEVSGLKEELRLFERGEIEDAPGYAAAGAAAGGRIIEWEGRICGELEALSERRTKLSQGEERLHESRLETRRRHAIFEEGELRSKALQVESEELRHKSRMFETEELVLQSHNRPLVGEVEALTEHYDQQKRYLFSYAAGLDRGTLRSTNEEQTAASSDGGPDKGVAALIKKLAQMYGFPEVAFLMLDLKATGRLSQQDLSMGLLLGGRIDYPALTSQSLRSLFMAMDRRGVGHITSTDLAACCPRIWQTYGAAQPSPQEKLHALPWKALGGAAEAFDAAVVAAANLPRDSKEVPPQACDVLQWKNFRDLVCEQILGYPDDEAYALFMALAEAQDSGPRGVTRAAWLDATRDRDYPC
eukprot:TRINITY_DN44249_c0_g1_i1.p1 TRINITY_DN44249_c0_g1~~TRINITY_DN44249_c0_g1_i1.p1  ORF type:complete len:1143 (-),score=179.76 TRINITY_DN44249_c0_g1_i1:7-3159(-)